MRASVRYCDFFFFFLLLAIFEKINRYLAIVNIRQNRVIFAADILKKSEDFAGVGELVPKWV